MSTIISIEPVELNNTNWRVSYQRYYTYIPLYYNYVRQPLLYNNNAIYVCRIRVVTCLCAFYNFHKFTLDQTWPPRKILTVFVLSVFFFYFALFGLHYNTWLVSSFSELHSTWFSIIIINSLSTYDNCGDYLESERGREMDRR